MRQRQEFVWTWSLSASVERDEQASNSINPIGIDQYRSVTDVRDASCRVGYATWRVLPPKDEANDPRRFRHVSPPNILSSRSRRRPRRDRRFGRSGGHLLAGVDPGPEGHQIGRAHV